MEEKMSKVSVLMKKSYDTLLNEGIEILLKKSIQYTKIHLSRNRNNDGSFVKQRKFVDVLFINGCFLPHPSRYRVSHQREQLLSGNMVSDEVFYEQLELDMVKYARVFIFFRCPYTETIGEFIKLAKQYNKKVVFDIDDLVIDKTYTEDIEYVRSMSAEEKKIYDQGVELIGKTLRLCDSAITTTERLAEELKKYVPEVYINRNVASEDMVKLSEVEIYKRDIYPYETVENCKYNFSKKEAKNILEKARAREYVFCRIGYFSGSITHNEDFYMILPIIQRLMREFERLELHIVGELDIPKELVEFRERIISHPFVDWSKLPELIANVDINLAPLKHTLFNEAKSENKWVEAALVKVPTVASNVGAFKRMIENEVTGFLCNSEDEWYQCLKTLIIDKDLRRDVANKAYYYVKQNCTSVYTGYFLVKYIRQMMTPNIAFILPTLSISGGSLVVRKHIELLKQKGYDVVIISEGIEKDQNIKYGDNEILCLIKKDILILGSFDKGVATLWSTVDFLGLYPNIKEKYYIVQNYETDFYKAGEFLRIRANQSYNACFDLKYITISQWCKDWLYERYDKISSYAKNGLELERFNFHKRDLKRKIRILIEGNSQDFYKNVDESFRIVSQLNKNQYEIWYMSYQGTPKEFYYVDKFLHKIPYEEVPSIYEQCDILIKSSILESFSYPPLEMMATGGYVVAVQNGGNVEYLEHEKNCLFYKQGDIEDGIQMIERLINDEILQNKLYENGLKTAKERDWKLIEGDVLKLYDVN